MSVEQLADENTAPGGSDAKPPAALSRRNVPAWIWLVFLAGAVGLMLLFGSLYRANQEANAERDRAIAWQSHTYDVMLTAERMLSAVFDAQRTLRGYMLSRDATFVAPFDAAAGKVEPLLARLRTLTRDNPEQVRRLALLDKMVGDQVDRMREAVLNGRAGRWAELSERLREGAGENTVGASRELVGQIVAEEQGLLRGRRAEVSRADLRAGAATRALSIAGSMLMLIMLLAGYIALRSGARARQALADAQILERARDALEAAVAVRTREIAASHAALKEEIVRSRAAEEQVRQLQKLESVGQLTGGIAHDFNNMLAIIIGSLDLVTRRLKSTDERVTKYLDNAMDGAKRAAALTARLLAFSRQQALAPQPLDANKFVGHISELLRRTLGEAIAIETVLAGGLWRTYADSGELENAIVNLAVNARDAMEGKGRLTIETANSHLDDAYAAEHAGVAPGQYVAVCVTDTGGGMPAEVVARAFDPFFTTKTVGKGTGLGLSQVYGFVKQSGGHVKIYSEAGKGTTVKLYLPRWFGPDAEIRNDDGFSGEMPRAISGEVVLVAEDEERVRLITVDALRDLGYTVIHASDGAAALLALEDQPRIDLLFTDIVMPGMTGRELADEAVSRRPGLKVLYTTGYTRNAVVHNGTLDANVAFLPKPFGVHSLAVKVRQVLDGGGINRLI